MWVRIREISFPADIADDVVNHARNTAVLRPGTVRLGDVVRLLDAHETIALRREHSAREGAGE